MNCRKIVKDQNNEQYTVVWFGAIGKDSGNHTIWADSSHTSYATEQEAVADSLIQRLSVLKGELWYKMSYGLPLLEKIRDKGIYDSIVLNIIKSHPDVKTIIDFSSIITPKHQYQLQLIITTIYTDEEISFDFQLNK